MIETLLKRASTRLQRKSVRWMRDSERYDRIARTASPVRQARRRGTERWRPIYTVWDEAGSLVIVGIAQRRRLGCARTRRASQRSPNSARPDAVVSWPGEWGARRERYPPGCQRSSEFPRCDHENSSPSAGAGAVRCGQSRGSSVPVSGSPTASWSMRRSWKTSVRSSALDSIRTSCISWPTVSLQRSARSEFST